MGTSRAEIDRLLAPPPAVNIDPDIDALIEKHSKANGVDPDLIRRIVQQESGGHTRVVSPKGAGGVMQLMPATAANLGVKDRFDPDQNIEAGTRYFRQQLDRFGNVDLALAAYNAGPERVVKHNRVPPFKETRDYVHRIGAGYQGNGYHPETPQRGDIDALLTSDDSSLATDQVSAPTTAGEPVADPAQYAEDLRRHGSVIADARAGEAPATPIAAPASVAEIPHPAPQPQHFVQSTPAPEVGMITPEKDEEGNQDKNFFGIKKTAEPLEPPFHQEWAGALGHIQQMGPQGIKMFRDFVRRNAPSGKVDAALTDEGQAQTFLKIQDFFSKNPKATNRETVTAIAQMGRDFLTDPSTKGQQLPRVFHDALIRAHYTPEEEASLPSKLRQQRAQFRTGQVDAGSAQHRTEAVSAIRAELTRRTEAEIAKGVDPANAQKMRDVLTNMSDNDALKWARNQQLHVGRFDFSRPSSFRFSRQSMSPVEGRAMESQKFNAPARLPDAVLRERLQAQIIAERQAQNSRPAPQSVEALRMAEDINPQSISEEVERRLPDAKKEQEWNVAHRSKIDALKQKMIDAVGKNTTGARLTESVESFLANSGVQAGNLVQAATLGRKGSGLVESMRLAQHALAELEQEDPDKGWLATAERILPGTAGELSKMILLSGIPGVGRATLPGLGALSGADVGIGSRIRGAVEGELFQRSFGLTSAMKPLGKFLTWTSIPAALSIAQGEDPKKALLSSTAFGALALAERPRVQVSDGGQIRDAVTGDQHAIENGDLKVVRPAEPTQENADPSAGLRVPGTTPQEGAVTAASPATVEPLAPHVMDSVVAAITKNYGGPEGLYGDYTPEGMKQIIGLRKDAAFQRLVDGGVAVRNEDGSYRFSDVIQSRFKRVGPLEPQSVNAAGRAIAATPHTEFPPQSDTVTPRAIPEPANSLTERRSSVRTPETDMEYARATAQAYGGDVVPDNKGFKITIGGQSARAETIPEAVSKVREAANFLDLQGVQRTEGGQANAGSEPIQSQRGQTSEPHPDSLDEQRRVQGGGGEQGVRPSSEPAQGNPASTQEEGLPGSQDVRRDEIDRLLAGEDEPQGVMQRVLAHIAGPSGAGKTELMEALRKRVSNLNLVDLDEFDDKAVESLGWKGTPKNDYTDETLEELHQKKQELVDKYIRESDKPIVFFGHHVEGDRELSLPADSRILLDVSPQTAAVNAARRPGKTAEITREDINIGRDDVAYLKGRGYEAENPRRVYNRVLGLSESQGEGTPARPVTRALPEASPVGDTTLPEQEEAPAIPSTETSQPAAFGPGAANVGDTPEGRTVSQLTEAISKLPKGKTVKETMRAALDLADKFVDTKDNLRRAFARVIASAKATIVPRDVNNYMQAYGDFDEATQRNAHEIRQFIKQVRKAVPSKLRREAIVNYIQADGDIDLLNQRAQSSKLRRRLGYQEATRLTDEEKTVAKLISAGFDSGWQEANKAGIIHAFIENYVPQIWKRMNPVAQRMMADVQRGMLDPSFKFSKQRVFESFFEGEQAGYRPATKDVGDLYATWNEAMQKAIQSRNFIQSLHDGTMPDGMPIAEVSGSGAIIERGNPSESVFLRPRTKQAGLQEQLAQKRAGEPPVDLSRYQSIPHPATQGWKWITSVERPVIGEDGQPEINAQGEPKTQKVPVYMRGEMVFHPDAYTHLKNVLGTSWFAGDSVKQTIARGVMKTGTTIKGTMFGLLPEFHLVGVATHAIGHRINPFNLVKIDFEHPIQSLLMKRGAMIASFRAASQYGEGLMSGNLLAKIPWLGDNLIKPHQDWLFQDYIPRLKMTMMLDAFERNTKRYSRNLNTDQIAELTASQGNAAFGEQNWRYLGYHPTTVDAMRTFLLAPDFFVSRAKFVGQAVKPYGREQLMALGLLAATQYIASRLLNKLSDDDYHFELENAFKVIHKGRWYGMRTVPADIAHLISDPRGFFYHRLSPVVVAGITAATQRDDRGQKVDAAEQIKGFLKNATPVQFRRHTDDAWWEAAGNSMGLTEGRYYTPAEEVVRDYHKNEFPSGTPTSANPEHAALVKQLVKRERAGQDIDDDTERLIEEGKLSQADIKGLRKKGGMSAWQASFIPLPLATAVLVYEKASKEQREELTPLLKRKMKRNLKKLPEAERDAIRERIDKVME